MAPNTDGKTGRCLPPGWLHLAASHALVLRMLECSKTRLQSLLDSVIQEQQNLWGGQGQSLVGLCPLLIEPLVTSAALTGRQNSEPGYRYNTDISRTLVGRVSGTGEKVLSISTSTLSATLDRTILTNRMNLSRLFLYLCHE